MKSYSIVLFTLSSMFIVFNAYVFPYFTHTQQFLACQSFSTIPLYLPKHKYLVILILFVKINKHNLLHICFQTTMIKYKIIHILRKNNNQNFGVNSSRLYMNFAFFMYILFFFISFYFHSFIPLFFLLFKLKFS